jgi:hypothetical protein
MTQMRTTLGVSSSATERWASEFDAKLQALHQEVQRSLRTRNSTHMKATPGKYSRRISPRATRLELAHRGSQKVVRCPEEQFLRVVTPAILYYVSRGVPCQKLVGYEEGNLACLNPDDRKALLQQLLQLRFMLWIFINEDLLPTLIPKGPSSQFRSHLVIEGGLVASWTDSMIDWDYRQRRIVHRWTHSTEALRRAMRKSWPEAGKLFFGLVRFQSSCRPIRKVLPFMVTIGKREAFLVFTPPTGMVLFADRTYVDC